MAWVGRRYAVGAVVAVLLAGCGLRGHASEPAGAHGVVPGTASSALSSAGGSGGRGGAAPRPGAAGSGVAPAGGASGPAPGAAVPQAAHALPWPPSGVEVHGFRLAAACGAFCALGPGAVAVLGDGVAYPGAAPFPSAPLGVASPAPRGRRTWLTTALLWRDAAGQARTLYRVPAGWVILDAVADGRWVAIVAGPAVPDFQSVALAARAPWSLVAVDAAGTVRNLASSSGGGDAPPPLVALRGDRMLWAVPWVPGAADPGMEDLAAGTRRAVDLGLPAGFMIDGLGLTAAGDPLVTAGPANAGGAGYLVRGGRPLALPMPPAAALPDGTLLGVRGGRLYTVAPGAAPRRVAVVGGNVGALSVSASGGVWALPAASGGVVVRLDPAGWRPSAYRLPKGAQIAVDGAGAAWWRAAAPPDPQAGGATALHVWWFTFAPAAAGT